MSFAFSTLQTGDWADPTVWHTAINFTSPPSGNVCFIADTNNVDEFPAGCLVAVGTGTHTITSVNTTGGQHEITLDTAPTGTDILSLDLPTNGASYDTTVSVFHNLAVNADTGYFTTLLVASGATITVGSLHFVNATTAVYMANTSSIAGARFSGGCHIFPNGDNCNFDLSYCDFQNNVYLDSGNFSNSVWHVNSDVVINSSGGTMTVASGSAINCPNIYLRGGTNCHFDCDVVFNGSWDIGGNSVVEINSGFTGTFASNSQNDDGTNYVNGEYTIPEGYAFGLMSAPSTNTNFYVYGVFSFTYFSTANYLSVHQKRKAAVVSINGVPTYYEGPVGGSAGSIGLGL